MGSLLIYMVKSACCLAFFYLFYKLLLGKETFHRFNRFALLGVLVLSGLLPFVQIARHASEAAGSAQVQVGQLTMQSVVVADNTFPWQWLFIIVYLLGLLFFALKLLISYGQLLHTVHRSTSISVEGEPNVRLILLDKSVSPFSWMRYVVMTKSDYQENGRAILTHEIAHIHRFHSIDMLLCDIFILFQWFNPAAWLVKKELQNIHEFEADDEVLSKGIDPKSYQLLLIKKAVGTRLYSMANSFNHSSLKKRITMMLKEKSNPWARLKYLYILPLAAVSVAAFASPKVSEPLNELSSLKVSDLSAYFHLNADNSSLSSPSIVYDSQKPDKKKVTKKVSSTDSSIYNVPEEMPQYLGGTSALLSFIGANLKYPADAKENKVEGKVFIQFVVNSEGKVQDAKVVKRLSSSCDNEALRVVNMMGRWIPGKQKGKPVNVKYTLPIMFSMGNNETASADDGEKAYQKVDVLPLYPGGQSEMMKYISQNLRYPKDAAAAGMQGKIIVQFIVGKTGAITHACILRGVSESLNKEALRIVNGMPKWTPGKVSGEPVSVSYCMPIVFKLDGGKTAATESEKPNSTDEVVVVGYN